jgi:hypothetical protein
MTEKKKNSRWIMIYFLFLLLLPPSLFLAFIMWPFSVTFIVTYVYMIEQLWCLYTFFSCDEVASMERGKKNKTRPKKERKKSNEELERHEFLFLSFPGCFPIYWEMEGREKKYMRLVLLSFSFCLSFSRYISALLLLLLLYALSCIYNIILHHHTHTGTSFYSSFSFSRVAFHYCVIICSKHAKCHLL